jgi:hypothetical protein
MNTTPIEKLLAHKKDAADREKHDAVMAVMRAQGADFDCATMAGFAATDNPPTRPTFCERCRRRGVRA